MLPKCLEPEYLIRFDDLNDCMNWEVWDEIEFFLDSHNIKPLVAVIPNNKDISVGRWEKNARSKERFTEMHRKGYEVCMHGYDHVYISDDPGIYGFTSRSEFAGVNISLQEEKIRKGKEILKSMGISPRCWIGPNHSYDQDTIDILKRNDFQIISDGLHRLPYMYDEQIMMVPTQKWKMNAFFPGLFTVCYHHNNWDERMMSIFKRDVISNLSKIVRLDDVLDRYQGRQKSLLDSAVSISDRFISHYLKVKLHALIR